MRLVLEKGSHRRQPAKSHERRKEETLRDGRARRGVEGHPYRKEDQSLRSPKKAGSRIARKRLRREKADQQKDKSKGCKWRGPGAAEQTNTRINERDACPNPKCEGAFGAL